MRASRDRGEPIASRVGVRSRCSSSTGRLDLLVVTKLIRCSFDDTKKNFTRFVSRLRKRREEDCGSWLWVSSPSYWRALYNGTGLPLLLVRMSETYLNQYGTHLHVLMGTVVLSRPALNVLLVVVTVRFLDLRPFEVPF